VHRLRLVLTLFLLALPLSGHSTRRWGERGHILAAQAAVDALPAEMPAFFRAGRERLAYYNPEPDRWRGGPERGADRALDDAGAPEHYIDLELIPAARRAAVLAAANRHDFADSLRGIGERVQTVGLLPFAMLEHVQRLRVGFRQWRAARTPAERLHIEARILNDAGILGHYVTDASNPAHTTIHFNGWKGPNPRGYATDNRFHSRFEGGFVQAVMRYDDVRGRVPAEPRVFPDLRQAVLAHIDESHAQVEALYAQDKATPFGVDQTDPAAKAFAADRLAAGARMLRDLWWTAWVTSAPAPRGP
jgi:hypothetical protein